MDGVGYSTMEVRVRGVQAVLAGTPINHVGPALRVDRASIHRLVRRPLGGDGDARRRRRPVSGRPRKLQCISEYNLKRIVLAPASRFGFETDLWTVSRLHAVLVDRFNEDVSEDTVWRRLRDVGLTWQTPEREYFQADAE